MTKSSQPRNKQTIMNKGRKTPGGRYSKRNTALRKFPHNSRKEWITKPSTDVTLPQVMVSALILAGGLSGITH